MCSNSYKRKSFGRGGGEGGYTLLELMIVVTIVAILATLAEPMWQESVTRAREASLKQTLFTVRERLRLDDASWSAHQLISLSDIVRSLMYVLKPN